MITTTIISVLFVIFVIFLIRAYYEDLETMKKIQTHKSSCIECQKNDDLINNGNIRQAIVEIIQHENDAGRLCESDVKKIMVSARDQIFRGVIMGLIIDGTFVAACQSAMAFSLVGGIVSGVSDMMGWRIAFF